MGGIYSVVITETKIKQKMLEKLYPDMNFKIIL